MMGNLKGVVGKKEQQQQLRPSTSAILALCAVTAFVGSKMIEAHVDHVLGYAPVSVCPVCDVEGFGAERT